MNVWNLALAAAFIAAAASGAFYVMAGNISRHGDPSALSPVKSRDRARNIAMARAMMGTSFALVAVASAGLLSMFLRHDFRFEYVANNSSRGLDNIYLVSAFWAGQEGSLLLWALFSGFFGCMLMLTAKKNEESSMPWYALAHLMILAVTLRMSPFTMLAEPAADGIGLNPLLMNPWMAIHPPVIFAGYAAIAAPYALAMGALVRKDYHGWVPVATWWNLLAWLLLGAGIMIGARWAYAVLGWGGYWGWDPVENASLVPWIFGGALLHTFLSQKARGKMVRTNIALSVVTYLLIAYGTFLTRSGVLSDFSVHSFSDLGLSSYLLLFILLIGAPALVLYLARFKDMTAARKYEEVYERWTSRDFGVFIGASVLLASGLITLLGTSAPILTGTVGEAQAVDTSFYNITNYPLGILIAVIMGAFPMFRWGMDMLRSAKAGLIASFALAAAVTAGIMLTGAGGAAYLAFMFASLFGFFSNLYMFAKVLRNGIRHVGGYMTHLGVALVFAGIIATAGWAVSERAMVPIGGSVEVAGLTVEASSPVTSQDGNTVHVPLKLYKDGTLFQEGSPYMQMTRMNSILHGPMIHSSLTEDIYISPLTLEGSSSGMSTLPGKKMEIGKGQTVASGGFEVSFSTFDLTEMSLGKVGAGVKVAEEGTVLFDGKLFISVAGTGGDESYAVFQSKEGRYVLTLESINASSGKVFMDLAKASEEKSASGGSFLIEVSRKPFVSLLWIGAILITLGTAIATVKRFMEAK
ncbi:MAG TPA: cytochrome c biogenesis protein CcsA [Bacillota bacterium]|nr:cytochrome c biogenesis protein CcsA [Bacillota bacterium]HOG52715.1 cytochrome c biogenesis protein CcsA [Bacillota bacterium]